MKPSLQTILSLGLESTLAPVAPAYELPSSAFGVPGNATFDYVVVGGGTAGSESYHGSWHRSIADLTALLQTPLQLALPKLGRA
jgi:hypothetical protein